MRLVLLLLVYFSINSCVFGTGEKIFVNTDFEDIGKTICFSEAQPAHPYAREWLKLPRKYSNHWWIGYWEVLDYRLEKVNKATIMLSLEKKYTVNKNIKQEFYGLSRSYNTGTNLVELQTDEKIYLIERSKYEQYKIACS